jgi:hypothetical protein
MTVTDEMVEAAMPFINITYADSEMKARAILEAALSTIKPMTARDIDRMLERSCIDDTADLVEAVEYWHGIRE